MSAGAFDSRRSREGQLRIPGSRGLVEEATAPKVGGQQSFDFAAQFCLARTGLIQVGGPPVGGFQLQCHGEDCFFVHRQASFGSWRAVAL